MWIEIIFILSIVFSIIFWKEDLYKVLICLKYQYKLWVYYTWVTIVCIFFLPLLVLQPKNVKNAVILAECIKHVTKVIGVRWDLRNGRVLSEDRGAVIVANHQSSLDILGQFNIWKIIGKKVNVCKKEISYIVPYGLVLNLIDSIFIDRKRPIEAIELLQTKSEHFFKNKVKIWIYPEGTRNYDPANMMPFKKGAFLMAVASQVPIIPVVFSPYYFINKKQGVFGRGHIIVQCLEPVPTVGLEIRDIPDLIQRVQGIMQSAYKESAKEIHNMLSNNNSS